jgi:hypothetical protein
MRFLYYFKIIRGRAMTCALLKQSMACFEKKRYAEAELGFRNFRGT